MANPQLSVELSAKIDNLRDGFNKAINEIGVFDKKAKTKLSAIDKQFEKLANDIEKSTSKASTTASRNLASIAATSEKMGGSVANGAGRASLALTNLGRVAQDAPFGFIGIQNNLNPLLESFQALRKESGSNVGALKALGSSLIGAGGIGLALSAVTAAVTFAQMGMRAWGIETKKAEEEAKTYAETLGQVRQVQLEGAQNAQKELVDVRLLYQAYTDANLPLERRKQAYEQLQRDYPAYFANLKFEEKAGDATAAAYNRLTTSILASARARAASEKIAENERKKLEIDEKQTDLLKEANKQRMLAIQLENKIAQGGTGLGAAGYASMAEKATEAEKDLQKQVNELLKEKNKLTDLNTSLANVYLKNVEQGALNEDKITKAKKEQEKLNKIILAQQVGGVSASTGVTANISTSLKGIQDLQVQSSIALQRLRNEFAYTNEEIGFFVSQYGVSIENLLAQTEKLNNGAKSILEGGIVNTISGVAEAIGSSLASGANVAESAGKALLSSVGGVLIQLGELAIAVGVGLKGIQLALKSLNPVVAIAAGASLIALGAMFKAGANKIGGGSGRSKVENEPAIRGFATGGFTGRGGVNDVAGIVHRGEYVLPKSQVNQATGLPKQGALDGLGGGGVVVNSSLGISMRELVVQIDAERKRMNR